jgi:hypothetical protein
MTVKMSGFDLEGRPRRGLRLLHKLSAPLPGASDGPTWNLQACGRGFFPAHELCKRQLSGPADMCRAGLGSCPVPEQHAGFYEVPCLSDRQIRDL